jgi:hypothetical protein
VETVLHFRRLTSSEQEVVSKVPSAARHDLLDAFVRETAGARPYEGVHGLGVSDGLAGVVLAQRLIAWVKEPSSITTSHEYEVQEIVMDESVLFGAAGLLYSRAWESRLTSHGSDQEEIWSDDMLSSESGTDLYTGAAGTLLARISLSRVTSKSAEDLAARDEDRILAERVLAGLMSAPTNPGVAHGRAGMLFALLAYHERYQDSYFEGVLRDAAGAVARSLNFENDEPQWVDPADTVTGFCNGTSGILVVALMAMRLLGSSAFRGSLRRLIEITSRFTAAPPHLCCGLAGQAFALTAAYRDLGEIALLVRSLQLAEAAAIRFLQSPTDVSLFRGWASIAIFTAFFDQDYFPELPLLQV